MAGRNSESEVSKECRRANYKMAKEIKRQMAEGGDLTSFYTQQDYMVFAVIANNIVITKLGVEQFRNFASKL